MIMTFFDALFALVFSCLILFTIKLNGNPNRLTVRGLRFLFITLIPVGFMLAIFATNFTWICDTTTGCHIGWGLSF